MVWPKNIIYSFFVLITGRYCGNLKKNNKQILRKSSSKFQPFRYMETRLPYKEIDKNFEFVKLSHRHMEFVKIFKVSFSQQYLSKLVKNLCCIFCQITWPFMAIRALPEHFC